MRALLLALPLLLANAPDDDSATVDPTVVPATIKAMLEAAMESGNENDVAVIVKYARTASPATAGTSRRATALWPMFML